MINDTICRASFAAGETRSTVSRLHEAKEGSGRGRVGILRRTTTKTRRRKELVKFNELEVGKNFAFRESCAKYATVSSPSRENPKRRQFKQVLSNLKCVCSHFEQPLRKRNKIVRYDSVDSLNLAYISLLFLPILAVKCLPGK